MYICTFKYTLEDVDCRFCKEYKHNRCTAANGCSCITERIEADAADYSEIVRGRGHSRTRRKSCAAVCAVWQDVSRIPCGPALTTSSGFTVCGQSWG